MIVGIDPGLDGAIAFLKDSHDFVLVEDMPTYAGTGTRREVNEAELARIIKRAYASGQHDTVYLERVSAMPGQGVSSMFSFGCSYGIVRGVLSALGFPYELVTPQAWKKRAGIIGRNKDAARTMAQQLYPQAALGRKKDIGRADAILIARFGGK